MDDLSTNEFVEMAARDCIDRCNRKQYMFSWASEQTIISFLAENAKAGLN